MSVNGNEARAEKFRKCYDEIKRRRAQVDFATSQYRHALRVAQDSGFNTGQIARLLAEEKFDEDTRRANKKEYELYKSWVFGEAVVPE